MPRYYFNIRDGRDVFDETGTVLMGTKAVRIHMITTATEFFDQESERKDQSDWEMEAIDEKGNIVATMTFSVAERKA